jgi:hypothetical protein
MNRQQRYAKLPSPGFLSPLLIRLSDRPRIFQGLSPTRAYAQNKNVELVGRVTDEKTGDPLPGAVIHIKGTTHEVLSDNNGEFKFITGQRVPVTYIVTYVGYKAKEIEVDNYDHAELKLRASTRN